MASDETFIAYIANSVLDVSHPQGDLFCILLSNLAKRDSINTIFNLKRRVFNEKMVPVPGSGDKTTAKVDEEELKKFQVSRDKREAAAAKIFGPPNTRKLIDCLLECFVKGHDRSLNSFCNYDYLAYFFSDLSRFKQGREHFLTPQEEETGLVYPITKILVFTESPSKIRREGVASTIKNCLFDVKFHEKLVLDPEINILPYILLPLAGPEDIPEDEMFELPEELQLLPADKKREPEVRIMTTYVECIMLLTTTKRIREYLREKSVYTIIKLLHMNVQDEELQEECDRLVQVLQRDDDPDMEDPNHVLEEKKPSSQDLDDESDDDQITEII